MKFRYLGDKKNMVAFGNDFTNGNEPDVTDPHAIGKLSYNRHFAVVNDKKVSPGSAAKPATFGSAAKEDKR